MIFSKLNFSWAQLVKNAPSNNNNLTTTNVIDNSASPPTSNSSPATSTSTNRPFPGAEKFGDPKWFWWYVSRYQLPSSWIANRNKGNSQGCR